MYLSKGEKSIRRLPTTLNEIVCKIICTSKVIVKSIKIPDDNARGTLKDEWVKNVLSARWQSISLSASWQA